MPNDALKPANLLDEVKALLGGSSVNVELTENDIKVAIRKALRVYNHWRPGQGGPVAVNGVSSSVKRYRITHPYLAGVTRVEFVKSRSTGSSADPFYDESSNNAGGVLIGSDGFTAGQLAQRYSYREDAARVMGAEPDWKYIPVSDGIGDIYIDIPAGVPYSVCYYFTYYFSEKFDEAVVGLKNIPIGDTDWFTSYVAAIAKQIVGQARSKFGGIPDSGGSSTEVAGTSLVEDGKAEIETLTEQIKRRRRPMAPEVD